MPNDESFMTPGSLLTPEVEQLIRESADKKSIKSFEALLSEVDALRLQNARPPNKECETCYGFGRSDNTKCRNCQVPYDGANSRLDWQRIYDAGLNTGLNSGAVQMRERAAVACDSYIGTVANPETCANLIRDLPLPKE